MPFNTKTGTLTLRIGQETTTGQEPMIGDQTEIPMINKSLGRMTTEAGLALPDLGTADLNPQAEDMTPVSLENGMRAVQIDLEIEIDQSQMREMTDLVPEINIRNQGTEITSLLIITKIQKATEAVTDQRGLMIQEERGTL
jgi:hypothetical protein